jgi:site-specific recombinase XerD
VDATTPSFDARVPLGDRVRAALRVRHYSVRTERAYVDWIRRYWLFTGRRDPARLGAGEVTAFLNDLVLSQRVAAATQNQALAAILFLYRHVLALDLPWLDDLVRAERPHHLPVVMSRAEVRRVLDHMHGVPRLMAFLLYGAGLRLTSSTGSTCGYWVCSATPARTSSSPRLTGGCRTLAAKWPS